MNLREMCEKETGGSDSCYDYAYTIWLEDMIDKMRNCYNCVNARNIQGRKMNCNYIECVNKSHWKLKY